MLSGVGHIQQDETTLGSSVQELRIRLEQTSQNITGVFRLHSLCTHTHTQGAQVVSSIFLVVFRFFNGGSMEADFVSVADDRNHLVVAWFLS